MTNSKKFSIEPQGFSLTRRALARTAAAVGVSALAGPLAVRAAAPSPVVFHTSEASAEALVRIVERLCGQLTGPVGIKIHGGEAAVNLPLWRALQEHIPNSAFVETNWASDFGGSRRHTATHIETIRRQGVDFAPIDLLDRGEAPSDYTTVPVPGGAEMSDIEIPAALLSYSTVIVLTNFKIPSFAGYTGCVKNVGIGLVSPDAKARVHGPGYNRERGFFVRLADAAKGVAAAMGPKLVHVNVVTDIRPEPAPGAANPKHGTLGIFASRDMTACDAAVVDALYGLTPAACGAMDERTKIDRGFLQLECLAAIGAGSRTYTIERI